MSKSISDIPDPVGAALRELLAGVAPAEADLIDLSPLAGGFSGAALFRVCVRWPGGETRSFVLKRTGTLECKVHRLLDRELPGTAVELLGSCRARESGAFEDTWFLLMRDIAGYGEVVPEPIRHWGVAPGGRGTWRQGLARLARMHGRFAERAADLRTLGLAFRPPAWCDDNTSALAVCAALRVCAGILALPMESSAIDEVEDAARRLPEHLLPLREPDNLTLVHGDFHQGNVAAMPDGSIRIVDWGEATLHVPAWDLVAHSEEEIRDYLEVRAAEGIAVRDDSRFFRQLRAATIGRMLGFLQACIRVLLGDGPSGAEEGLARCLPMCTARLIEAASDRAFRGGRGLLGSEVGMGVKRMGGSAGDPPAREDKNES
jgi:hypothetical protein